MNKYVNIYGVLKNILTFDFFQKRLSTLLMQNEKATSPGSGGPGAGGAEPVSAGYSWNLPPLRPIYHRGEVRPYARIFYRTYEHLPARFIYVQCVYMELPTYSANVAEPDHVDADLDPAPALF